MTYPCQSGDECVEGYNCLNGNCAAQSSGDNPSAPDDNDNSDTEDTNEDTNTDTTTPDDTDDTPQELINPIEGTLACGTDFCCGIRAEDGRLTCWGDNPGSSGTATSGIANETQSSFDWITAQGNRFCGVTTEGGIECFGGGSPPPNKEANGFTQVSASANYACAIRQGELECWGYDEPEPTNGQANIKSISTASYSACTLDESNTINCWGNYTFSVPRSTWDTIAITHRTHCGIADEQLYCWGDYNPLGTQAPVGDTFIGLSVSEAHLNNYDFGRSLCALTKFGAVDCSCCKTTALSDDECNSTENVDVCSDQPSATNTSDPFIQIAVGDNYACAMRTDGTVTCWGGGTNDGFGGPDRMENQNPPSDVVFKHSRD